MPYRVPIRRMIRQAAFAGPVAAVMAALLLSGCDTRGAATSEAIARAEAAALRAEAAQRKAEAAAKSVANAPAPEVPEPAPSDPSVTPFEPDPNEQQQSSNAIRIDN